MKRTSNIIVSLFFCLCATGTFAQTKNKHKTDWLGVNKELFAPAGFIFMKAPAPQFTSMLCVKTEPPKLAFFCSMEEKFRNKFNVFLKLRAGTDDAYMRLIKRYDP